MRKAFRSLGLDTQGFVGRSSFLYPDYQYLFIRLLLEYTIRLRQSRQWELPEWTDMEIPDSFKGKDSS